MDKAGYTVKLVGGRNIWFRTDVKAVMSQITLHESEIMPPYSTLHNIDLRVVWGRIGLMLNDGEAYIYNSGCVISIPAKTKINLFNYDEDESTVFMVRT